MYTIRDNKIKLTRGDTLLAIVTPTRNGEPYVPEQGDVIRFAMKHNEMDIQKKRYIDPEPLVEITIPTDTLLLTIEPNDTKPYEFGVYAYDVEITFANGDVDTFISNTITLTPEVD